LNGFQGVGKFSALVGLETRMDSYRLIRKCFGLVAFLPGFAAVAGIVFRILELCACKKTP
jgi:hypothetical protein